MKREKMEQNLVLPNLVIAGAPKCGSTSLYHYLSAHPEVCASFKEESRYLLDKNYPLFNKDFNYLSQGLDGYAYFFNHCTTSEHPIIMDSTPDYFYQETALNVLSALVPKPTIIFILRDPVKRAYSTYQYARNNMTTLDPKLSFSKFIDQIKNEQKKYFNNRPILENALEHGKYSYHLKNWLNKFDKNSLIVVLFEDMKKDPRAFMKKLASKLGIDDKFYDTFSFDIKNQTVAIRNRTLHRFKKKLKLPAQIPLFRDIGSYFYNSLNTKVLSPISNEDRLTMQTLYSDFEAVNQELAKLYGLDISSWNYVM